MRRGLFLARGADPNVPGSLSQVGQMGCTQVAHARLDPTDELADHGVERGGDFLEGFDALSCGLAGIVGRVAVACSRTGLHGCMAAHAAVLLVELSVDFDDLSGCLPGSRQTCLRR